MEKRSKLYFWYDILIFYLTLPKAEMHTHHPMQITIGLDSTFGAKVSDNDWANYKVLLTGADVPHALNLENTHAFILQIFPETEAGQALNHHFLRNKKYESFPFHIIEDLLPKLRSVEGKKRAAGEVRAIAQELLDTLLGRHYFMGFDKALDPRVKTAMESMQQMTRKKISLEEMAEKVHLSPSRFRHLFKQETGITFRNMLMQMRVAEVLKYAEDEKSLTRIAYETGFSDLAHLSRVFKKVGGISPSTYINARKFLEVYTD